jgi:hypothetical protein
VCQSSYCDVLVVFSDICNNSNKTMETWIKISSVAVGHAKKFEGEPAFCELCMYCSKVKCLFHDKKC